MKLHCIHIWTSKGKYLVARTDLVSDIPISIVMKFQYSFHQLDKEPREEELRFLFLISLQ